MHDGLALGGRGSVTGELQLQHLGQGLGLLAHLVRLVLADDASPPLVDVVEDPGMDLVIQPIDILLLRNHLNVYARRVVAHCVLSLFVRSPRHIHNVDEDMGMTQIIQELGLIEGNKSHLVSESGALARSRNQSSDIQQLYRNLSLPVFAKTINRRTFLGAMPLNTWTLGQVIRYACVWLDGRERIISNLRNSTAAGKSYLGVSIRDSIEERRLSR